MNSYTTMPSSYNTMPQINPGYYPGYKPNPPRKNAPVSCSATVGCGKINGMCVDARCRYEDGSMMPDCVQSADVLDCSIKKKDKKDKQYTQSFGDYLYKILLFFITCIALYLSVRCNGGFDLGASLVAFFCSPFYIIYKLILIPKDVMKMCNNIPIR